MSQPISIVREQEIGYNEHGQATRSDKTFVKVSVELLGLLRTMQGARLSAFLCLALNEAEISLGSSIGMSVYDISEWTGYKVRATLYALQFLSEKNFISKLEQRGEKGESLYRASAYAWFGNARANPTASNSGYAKNAHPVAKCTGVQRSSSSTSVQSRFELDSTSTTSSAEAILTGCGVLAHDLDLNGMTDRDAQAIAQYVADNPESRRSPAGWVYTLLKANPRWRPPEQKSKHWWRDEYDGFVNR